MREPRKLCEPALRTVTSRMHASLPPSPPMTLTLFTFSGINLTTEANGGLEGAQATGQALMMEIQKSIFLYQGSINKMAVDDKGLITIAVFGLPPLPHDDDPRRAVHAAMALGELCASSCIIQPSSFVWCTGRLHACIPREGSSTCMYAP